MWFSRHSKIPVKNKSLLQLALTHRSQTNGRAELSNERLEFLGDAILGAVVSQELYRRRPDWDQGHLSRARASIVQQASLAIAAQSIRLNELTMISEAEEAAGGREKPSILGDAYEAVVAAVYLDRGWTQAQKFVLETLREAIEQAISGDLPHKDFKSLLQEATQATWRQAPTYRVIDERGDPHMLTFVVEARLGGDVLGVGEGGSKKEAEQRAAEDALNNLETRRSTINGSS
ncbi:MAG: ribonuclease III [Armatimonadetes bacterium]|nr:ribonuclease III [Armatimonadota bacterium]